MSDGSVVEGTEEAALRPVSKLDLKRAQILEERKRRLINRGVAEENVNNAIAKEDFENLTTDKKVSFLYEKLTLLDEKYNSRCGRTESVLSGAVQGLRRDVISLQHNDTVIADALDINLHALAKCLEILGLSTEKQGEIVKQVQAEIVAEQEKQKKLAAEAAEKAKITEGAKSTEEAPVVVPEGATVFEG